MARAFDQVGDGWSLLLLREAFKGARAFHEFEEKLAIPPSTLARKLASFCANEILVRRSYQTRPPREDYALTEKGISMLPVLLALGEWGNRWLAPEGALIVPIDPGTGDAMTPVLVDERTGEPIRAGHVALGAGAGASRSLRRDLQIPVVLAAAPVVA